MIDLISELAKFFEPELRLHIQQNSIQIKEEQNINKKGTLKQLNIKNLPPNSVAFTLDYHATDKDTRNEMILKYGQKCFDKLSWPIRDGYMDVNRTCDFIIFSKQEQTYRILVGEMKSSLKDDKIPTQLSNSRIFVDYALNLLQTAHGMEIDPEYRLAVFANLKDTNFDKNSIMAFYKKQIDEQDWKQGNNLDLEILPFQLPAQSGIANCEYNEIFGS